MKKHLLQVLEPLRINFTFRKLDCSQTRTRTLSWPQNGQHFSTDHWYDRMQILKHNQLLKPISIIKNQNIELSRYPPGVANE